MAAKDDLSEEEKERLLEQAEQQELPTEPKNSIEVLREEVVEEDNEEQIELLEEQLQEIAEAQASLTEQNSFAKADPGLKAAAFAVAEQLGSSVNPVQLLQQFKFMPDKVVSKLKEEFLENGADQIDLLDPKNLSKLMQDPQQLQQLLNQAPQICLFIKNQLTNLAQDPFVLITLFDKTNSTSNPIKTNFALKPMELLQKGAEILLSKLFSLKPQFSTKSAPEKGQTEEPNTPARPLSTKPIPPK